MFLLFPIRENDKKYIFNVIIIIITIILFNSYEMYLFSIRNCSLSNGRDIFTHVELILSTNDHQQASSDLAHGEHVLNFYETFRAGVIDKRNGTLNEYKSNGKSRKGKYSGAREGKCIRCFYEMAPINSFLLKKRYNFYYSYAKNGIGENN
jgi:hypothetical protein